MIDNTDCLKDVVGVKCLTQNPLSGLWVNDLPFINQENASNTADKEKLTGLKLLEEKVNFANKLVAQDLKSALMPFYRVNTTVDELLIGDYKTTYLTPSANQRGVHIKIRNSRLLRMRLASVCINIEQTAYTGQLTVIDGNNTTLYDYTTGAQGQATVELNYYATTREVYVVLEDDAINPIDTYVKKNCNCYNTTSEFIIGHGWNDASNASNAYGLKVQATAECDYQDLMCVIKHHLGFAILYKAGAEILKEFNASTRLNSFTMLMDKEAIDKAIEGNYKSYKKHLSAVIKSMPELFKRIDDICVVCNQSRFVSMTP